MKNPTTTAHVQSPNFTPQPRQAREWRRQVIAANISPLFTANIHPTAVNQPWQQAPRERPGKSSAGPTPEATARQVATPANGQGGLNQDKPSSVNGGHHVRQYFSGNQTPFKS